jgi:hypothetical protein
MGFTLPDMQGVVLGPSAFGALKSAGPAKTFQSFQALVFGSEMLIELRNGHTVLKLNCVDRHDKRPPSKSEASLILLVVNEMSLFLTS